MKFTQFFEHFGLVTLQYTRFTTPLYKRKICPLLLIPSHILLLRSTAVTINHYFTSNLVSAPFGVRRATVLESNQINCTSLRALIFSGMSKGFVSQTFTHLVFCLAGPTFLSGFCEAIYITINLHVTTTGKAILDEMATGFADLWFVHT